MYLYVWSSTLCYQDFHTFNCNGVYTLVFLLYSNHFLQHRICTREAISTLNILTNISYRLGRSASHSDTGVVGHRSKYICFNNYDRHCNVLNYSEKWLKPFNRLSGWGRDRQAAIVCSQLVQQCINNCSSYSNPDKRLSQRLSSTSWKPTQAYFHENSNTNTSHSSVQYIQVASHSTVKKQHRFISLKPTGMYEHLLRIQPVCKQMSYNY